MGKSIIEDAIEAMEKYYTEYGETQTLDYAFGFFDAIAVLRDMQKRTTLKDNKRVLSNTL